MIPLAVLCDSGLHCTTCRDRRQRRWRLSLAVAYVLPGGDVDFDCPRGLEWHGSPLDDDGWDRVVRGRIATCEYCDHEVVIGEARACKRITNAQGRPCVSLFHAALNGHLRGPSGCPWPAVF